MHPEKPDTTCETSEARFSAYLEGDLTENEAAALEAHLESCPKCDDGFQRFKEAVGALGSYTASPVPDSFLDAASNVAPTPVRPKNQPVPRRWPLAIAWCAATAATAAALFIHMAKPEPMRVEVKVPVEHRVVVEKEIEVPIPTPVKVPVPVYVSVPVQEGVLEVIRNNETIKLSAGDSLVFMQGDAIRVHPAPSKVIDVEKARQPVRVVVDLDPLAQAAENTAKVLGQAFQRMSDAAVATAEMRKARPVAAPVSGDEARPAYQPHEGRGASLEPIPAVALAWEDRGIVSLETPGPDHEVIPELLSLLDHENPQVRAAAQGGLENIRDRLFRDHGIRGPADKPASEANTDTERSYPDGIARITRLFTKDEETERTEDDRSAQQSPVENWHTWWNANQHPILCLAGDISM